MVMDRLTDEVRQESLWTMVFADDLVICEQGAAGKNHGQVEVCKTEYRLQEKIRVCE